MNRYAKAAIALAAAAGVGVCNNYLEGPGLTENPNNATQGTTLQQLIAVQANMFTRFQGQIARSASIYTQQLIGSNNQQLSWATQYQVVWPAN